MAPVDAPEFDRWRRQAGSALEAARSVTTDQPAWACFLSEQAAQLGAKALLHGLGLGGWGHDLIDLERRLREPLGQAWSGADDPVAGAVVRLTRHYIPTRYPDANAGGAPADRYTAADTREALGDAETVLSAVDAAWATVQAHGNDA